MKAAEPAPKEKISIEYRSILRGSKVASKGRYFIGDYSVVGHEDFVAVERKEGRG